MLASALIIVAAYLIGSISFAVVVSKAYGLPDPHEYGSRNPGATNVLRTGNKTAAVLTLIGDGIKGFVVVLAARALAQVFDVPDWIAAAAAVVPVGGVRGTEIGLDFGVLDRGGPLRVGGIVTVAPVRVGVGQ